MGPTTSIGELINAMVERGPDGWFPLAPGTLYRLATFAEEARDTLEAIQPLLDALAQADRDDVLEHCFMVDRNGSTNVEEALRAWRIAGYPGAAR